MSLELEQSDWLAMDVHSGPGRSLKAPLFRALGIHRGREFRPVVLDATAGYGTDAYLAAAAGCRVIAVERCEPVFNALRASWQAACKVHGEITQRIELIKADALDFMQNTDLRVDVVYLDPMFCGERKAAERKAMRQLRAVVGDDDDAARLLAPARQLAQRRVVVKRHGRAPFLDDCKPDLQFKGRGFRFDVYLEASRAR